MNSGASDVDNIEQSTGRLFNNSRTYVTRAYSRSAKRVSKHNRPGKWKNSGIKKTKNK